MTCRQPGASASVSTGVLISKRPPCRCQSRCAARGGRSEAMARILGAGDGGALVTDVALQAQRLTLDIVGLVAFSHDFRQAELTRQCVPRGFVVPADGRVDALSVSSGSHAVPLMLIQVICAVAQSG